VGWRAFAASAAAALGGPPVDWRGFVGGIDDSKREGATGKASLPRAASDEFLGSSEKPGIGGKGAANVTGAGASAESGELPASRVPIFLSPFGGTTGFSGNKDAIVGTSLTEFAWVEALSRAEDSRLDAAADAEAADFAASLNAGGFFPSTTAFSCRSSGRLAGSPAAGEADGAAPAASVSGTVFGEAAGFPEPSKLVAASGRKVPSPPRCECSSSASRLLRVAKPKSGRVSDGAASSRSGA
jgi:hypothetical protein